MSKKVKKEPEIEDALFPVELKPVFVDTSADNFFLNPQIIRDFQAVVDLDKKRIFAVVAQNYRLITNQEALQLGKVCFRQVFKLTNIEDMKLYNIIMPKTRSFCHIDYLHESAQFDAFKDDPWVPYIRITNSYNRMFALNFDLGFCRSICKNGIIFGKKNIEFKFHHSRNGKDPVVEFNLRAGAFTKIEAEFLESLKNLKRYHVPQKFMWPLACKVFEISVPSPEKKKQQEIFENRKIHIESLKNEYFSLMGENGYAALNVLTDFASRPIGYISEENSIDSLQKKTGEWIIEFVKAIEHREFNFEDFLGDYAKLAA